MIGNVTSPSGIASTLETFTFVNLDTMAVTLEDLIDFRKWFSSLRHLFIGEVNEESFRSGESVKVELELPRSLETLGVVLQVCCPDAEGRKPEGAEDVFSLLLSLLRFNLQNRTLETFKRLTLFTRKEEVLARMKRRRMRDEFDIKDKLGFERALELEGFCILNGIELVFDGQDMDRWIARRLSSGGGSMGNE